MSYEELVIDQLQWTVATVVGLELRRNALYEAVITLYMSPAEVDEIAENEDLLKSYRRLLKELKAIRDEI